MRYALSETRRILDQFAKRRGERTWQQLQALLASARNERLIILLGLAGNPAASAMVDIHGVAIESRPCVSVGGDINLLPSASTHRLFEQKSRQA